MTFRELLKTANLTATYQHINDKDNSYEGRPPIDVQITIDAYTKVVKELLGKKKTKPFKYKFYVSEDVDCFDKKQKHVNVSLFNPRYVAPAKGLKPWGSSRGEKVPEGYYNCNSNRHNKFFAFGSTKWSELIDTEIINTTQYSNERILAEILWELTFYGWSEKKVEQTWKGISKRVKEAKNDIKNGNYTEIKPKKKGDRTILVSDTFKKAWEEIKKSLKGK